MRCQLGLAGAGEDALQVHRANACHALYGGEIGKVPDLHPGDVRLAGRDLQVATNELGLVLLRPHDGWMSVKAGDRVGPELGHDNGPLERLPDRVQLLLQAR